MRRRVEIRAERNGPEFFRPPPESPLWGLTAPPVRRHHSASAPVRLHSECGCLEGARWYAVQTEPASERFAADEMRAVGFQSFLPLERVDRGQGVRRKAVTRPFFPRYLFALFDVSADPWGCLFRTRGVTQLITSEYGRPLPLPAGVVEGMMAEAIKSILGVVADNTDAEVERRRQEDLRKEAEALGPQMEGRELRVRAGTMTGFLVRCLAVDAPEQRVKVLLTLFGRPTEMDLPLTEVEIV